MNLNDDEGRVILRRRIAATREELFDAWTDPEGMRQWMCPGDILAAEVQLDLRVGGRLLIIMRSPSGAYEHRGEFKLIERPTKLVFSWLAKATNWEPTLVTIDFLALSDQETELILTHQAFPTSDVSDRYRGGWQQILAQLESSVTK